ncbi:hypothetical protein TWF694_005977 [Orbilia ellipsospora]|uniref:Cupredoxin n=1 Tax=Orbilia ellipsospora TaxID=2528407 RepID=A0AAV9WSI3_9PEZI
MLKAILSTSIFATSVFATQYGYPNEVYSQSSYMPQYTTVAQVSSSCTNMAAMHTAEPVEVAPSAYQGNTATPMVHTVIVGGDAGLVYTPESIYAVVGDIVEFHFMKQNHSVTQSTFNTPCIRKPDGIDSGLMPNPNNTIVPPPVFKYTVDTTDPTWWYCKQRTGTHCGKGMTFAINPTMEKSYDKFKSMAIAQNGTAVASTEAPAAVVVSSTATLIAGTETQAAPSAVATTVSGTGSNEGGSCQCQCFCGVGAYPSGYGINNFGGMPGVLPAPWAASSTAAAAAVTSAPSGGYYRR